MQAKSLFEKIGEKTEGSTKEVGKQTHQHTENIRKFKNRKQKT